MNLSNFKISLTPGKIGEEMHRLIQELYPICRSITGNGIRETLHHIQKHVPVQIHEVPTGTAVFDWVVPKEWNINDAYIKNSRGERVIDFKKSNLHVMGYSLPIKAKMPLSELKPHLHTLPEHPEWIPWRTSFYKEDWGFCLSHKQLLALKDEEYEVCIDASLKNGHLTYGECYLQGEKSDEVLLSCHACHPSLCNDNLSGVALVTYLAQCLNGLSLRYSYRFLFIPTTIGSITWLAFNKSIVPKIKHGLVAACVGDRGKSTYKKSRRDDAEIDQAFIHVLKHSGQEYEVIDFFPYGYDERQYCSPGFNLPVGCVMRTPHGRFPEYHTSADNLDFIRPECLADSLTKCLKVLYILENNKLFINQNPHGEPQLGKRGLYHAMGGRTDKALYELAMLWVLNSADGNCTLLDIAEKAGMPFETIHEAAKILLAQDLLQELQQETPPITQIIGNA